METRRQVVLKSLKKLNKKFQKSSKKKIIISAKQECTYNTLNRKCA